jgi:RNA polymerase sigma factor (sigma-70 family)
MVRQATSFSALVKQVLSKPFSRFSDSYLLDRFVDRGDELAFGAIVDRHGPMLLSLCRRHVGDAHLAEDVLQATFLLLVRKASSIHKRDSLAGWLHGVAQRLGRQARLSETARSRRERQAAEAHAETNAGDPAWDDLLRAVDDELKRLPDRHRLPLLLCYLEGRTQDEAARQLGWSLSTLRRRLEEGRDLLKSRLIRHGTMLEAGLFAGFLAPSAVRTVLTREVRQAVINTAMASSHGVAVSASVLVLANGAMRMSLIAKLLLCAAGVTVVCATVAGAVWQLGAGTPAVDSRQPPRVQNADVKTAIPQPAQKKEPLPGHDLFNDPLPKGAVARLGTVAFRHGRATGSWPDTSSLTFTADGRKIVSSGGGWVRLWDVATGHAETNLGDGARTAPPITQHYLVKSDGKHAIRVGLRSIGPPKDKVQTYPVTEFDLGTGNERTYQLEFIADKVGMALDPPMHLSPDGKTFAKTQPLGMGSGPITLWNAEDGKITHFLRPEKGGYKALAFHPSGKTLVVGDDSHTIRVFDLMTGKEQLSFGVPGGNRVQLMAISPDGKSLATSSGPQINRADPYLWLWDLETGKLRQKIDLPKGGEVTSMLFTPDSRTLIGGGGKTVRTWNAASGQAGLAWTLEGGLNDRGLTLAVSPDGKHLASMSEIGVIRLWDIQTGQDMRPVDASPCALESVCFSSDSKTLTTIGQDFALRQWDASAGKLLGPVRIETKEGYYPYSATLWAGGNIQATGFIESDTPKPNQVFRLSEPTTGKVLLENTGLLTAIDSGAKRLAARNKYEFSVFEITTGKLLHKFILPKQEEPFPVNKPLAFTSDGQGLIIYGATVSTWDLNTGKEKSSWNLLSKVDNTIPANPPFKTQGGEEKVLTIQNDQALRSAAVTSDGTKVAIAVAKSQGVGLKQNLGISLGVVRVLALETATGKILHQMDVEADIDNYYFPAALAFSPDGKRLALGGPWTISVWDLGTDKAAWEFEGHRGRVTALAFSPDGKRLVSASEDSTALVWDLTK